MNNIATLKDKIAKLLAKAEDPAATEQESETYTAHAEKLMLQFGIEKAELESAGQAKPEKIVQIKRRYTGGYAIVMIPFVFQISQAYGNINFLQAGSGNRRVAYLVGHESDLEMFEQLLNSLEAQASIALHAWQKTAPERKWQTSGERYIGSRSFLAGFGNTVAHRLRELRQQTEQEEASTGAALVLASKQDRVNEWVEEKYGKLKAGRGGAKNYDRNGAVAGTSAGMKANLGGKSIGENRAAIN